MEHGQRLQGMVICEKSEKYARVNLENNLRAILTADAALFNCFSGSTPGCASSSGVTDFAFFCSSSAILFGNDELTTLMIFLVKSLIYLRFLQLAIDDKIIILL